MRHQRLGIGSRAVGIRLDEGHRHRTEALVRQADDRRIAHPVVPAQGLRWKTYAERLEEAGISWRVYQHGPGQPHNLLRAFSRFMDAPGGSAL